ncbi:MAG: hypothetical protein WAM39_26620 [Bryobacteraceae bacterium]
MSQGLRRVREAATERKQEKFTALLHHVTVDPLRDSFYALELRAASGVDGVTWREYERLPYMVAGPATNRSANH